MPKFHVVGKVVGSKYLGCFEAATAEEAVEKALNEAGGPISLCHQCTDECEDGCVEDARADLAKE
ncbi:hypothetical protein [Methylobacterium nodulans]|uniref:Uncharacterized protein n=1 Tax=Methylobacterium nodulans (strain LMG 21967 / CNCM I-2342 / ORS 2060) TaxID=460265 RepID=B8IQN3_METNO|nr:hypothetical protein [Methylobacterium nodulans]ACL60545.1 hypothetical protein Mnod_5715 [Methylobacterium nodulans ORS 2060]